MYSTTRYVAQPFTASSPQAEMLGASLAALMENLQREDIMPFLEAHHLDKIEPMKWYPQQIVLDFERSIAESKINAIDSLVAIGMKGIDSMPFDPSIKTLEQAITLGNTMMRQICRNIPEEEGATIVENRPGYMLLVQNVPFPADMIYGYLWALTRRYRPATAKFAVKKIDNPNPDQNPGMAFEITWG